MPDNNNLASKKAIVKQNFKIAVFDAMNLNYFREDYDKLEKLMDAAMDEKLSSMKDEDINAFALSIIAGDEIGFDAERQDFFIIEP